MRPGQASELYSTWLGGGVMQSDHGEPGKKVPPAIIASSGILPIAGLAPGGTGTSMVNWRRNLPSPSKVLPALSQATSVTWRNRASAAGSGGFGCFTGPVSSSEASCLRPNTMSTRPSWSNLITMSEPLSVTQILSEGSTLTVWPNDQA